MIFLIILNIPWSLAGISTAILSLPKKVKFSKNPPAVIFYIRSFWWYKWMPQHRGTLAITNGNVIQLSDAADELDLKHELIHVEQFMKYPLFGAFLMLFEQIRYGIGPQKNRFEKEAYEKSGSRYLGKSII